MYIKQTWNNGDVITSAKMNHIEDGIEDVQSTADGAASSVNALSANGAIGTANLANGAVTPAKLDESATDIVSYTFSTPKAYSADDYVIYSGALYRFTADKAAGSWDATKVRQIALADDLTLLSRDVDNARIFQETPFFASDFQQGVWGIGTGLYNANFNNFICSKGYILNESIIKIACPNTHKMRIQAWDSSDTYKGAWNGSNFVTVNPNYYRESFDLSYLRKLFPNYRFKIVVCAQDGTSEVSVNDGANIVCLYSFCAEQAKFNMGISALQNYSPFMEWEIGSIFGNNGADYDSNVRTIRTPNAKRIYLGYDAVFECNNNNVVMIYAFKYNPISGAFIERIGAGDKNNISLEKGYEYRLAVFAPDGTTITDETISLYSDGVSLFGNDLSDIYAVFKNTQNYAVDSSFGKTNRRITRLGTMLYGQSFCIYNSKVYSTDGSHIGVQNLNTFGEISRTDVSCGHGNAFHVGSSNLAYISGWDDNKVYVIDLDTVTLIDTITLPTTGYTTCAVDDVNKLIYIFRLTTAPSIGGYYDFIVYDYDNEQIVNTKKIPMWIRAMQGVDFVNGKIVVLSGLGTSTNGNKYSIFNTSGDLISRFVIGEMESDEPEGVFVDRDNDDVYISYINQYTLYKLI